MSKKWKIPVSWEMCGVVCIEADTLAEAIDRANNDDSIALPVGNYVDSSFEVSMDDFDCIRSLYNNNQSDAPLKPNSLKEAYENATFVSVWDGGTSIETNCKVNSRTGEVFDIEVLKGASEYVDQLEREYVRLADGREIPVVFTDGHKNNSGYSISFPDRSGTSVSSLGEKIRNASCQTSSKDAPSEKSSFTHEDKSL